MRNRIPMILAALAALACVIALPAPDADAQATHERTTQEIRNILSTRLITLDLDEATLDETMELFASVTGLNFVVDPRLYDERDEDEFQITLRLERVAVIDALRLIAQFKDLRAVNDGGIVLITSKERREDEMSLRIVEVHDLVQPLRDFPGPKITLEDGDDGGGAGFFPDEDEGSSYDPDEIVDLITEHVAPDTWDEDGVSIRYTSGKLIIRQSPEVFAEIDRLLDMLRAAR